MGIERKESPTQYFTGLWKEGRRTYARVWDSYLKRPYWVLLTGTAQYSESKKRIIIEGVGTIVYDEDKKYFIHED